MSSLVGLAAQMGSARAEVRFYKKFQEVGKIRLKSRRDLTRIQCSFRKADGCFTKVSGGLVLAGRESVFQRREVLKMEGLVIGELVLGRSIARISEL